MPSNSTCEHFAVHFRGHIHNIRSDFFFLVRILDLTGPEHLFSAEATSFENHLHLFLKEAYYVNFSLSPAALRTAIVTTLLKIEKQKTNKRNKQKNPT